MIKPFIFSMFPSLNFFFVCVLDICKNEFLQVCSFGFSVLKDGKIEPEDFTSRLYRELNSSPQPYLVPFLKVTYLHYSFLISVLIDQQQ